jgi:2-dehydro-3-deoxyphosphogluconate aldolase/(4S)-4-hydroxy-2-oxoglutarate aldolase
MTDDLGPALREHRIVAVLRARDGAGVRAAVHRLVGAGIRLVELTFTTPGAAAAVRHLRSEVPADCLLGLGSTRTADDVRVAADSGARFVVSAVALDLDAHAEARREGVAVIPGAATPTEIHAAWTRDVPAVKLFPASLLGGPAAVAAVRQPLPDVPLLPTGGVALADVGPYLAAGAVAVGLGSALTGDALEPGGDLGALAERARLALRLAGTAG